MDFEILGRDETPEGWRCRVAIPERHPAFDGHFPGQPVFPGIAHLAVAGSVIAGTLTGGAEIVGVPFLRLRHPVAPGDVLEVTVGRPADDGTVAVDIRRGEERVSHGAVVVRRRG